MEKQRNNQKKTIQAYFKHFKECSAKEMHKLYPRSHHQDGQIQNCRANTEINIK